MKILVVTLFTIILSSANAQTNIISLKDRAGDISEIQYETDNFGLPNWKMGIDTVVFVKTGCIVEITNQGECDTLYAERYEEILTTRFENEYSDFCVFIGFKKKKQEEIKNNFFDDMKRNGFPIIVLIVLGFLGFHSLSRND